ncbi:MAG: nucleotidyltransferase family protein [Candidatus Accumulibacter sp.]|jgi:MurNAc alpha-1-phosphate uridylyltransferase|nr:nucleotidyltransferase family protein [Accumulibacter sp.]
MKVMILAAGRGERLRPLTDTTPKPLLRAGGKPLIVWQLERLAADGFREIVINHAYLGEQIEAVLGDGQRFGLNIRYSPEPHGALETAGGIANALALLGDEPFLVINGDVWCDWKFDQAHRIAYNIASNHARLAHLVLVDNPPHHPLGDFSLEKGILHAAERPQENMFTYAGIGVFSPGLFAGIPRGTVMRLRPLLDREIARGTIGGEYHSSQWIDAGTRERLADLDKKLSTGY